MSTEERWSAPKTAAAVSIAVVIAAAGGAAIWAGTANEAGTGPAQAGPRPSYSPGSGRYFGMGALDTALHGEFVIADGTTEVLQTGKATEISATSIAVLSSDGYTKTYTIGASTLLDQDIASGDQVTVIAKKSDNVAISVVERTTRSHRRGQPQQPPQPTPR